MSTPLTSTGVWLSPTASRAGYTDPNGQVFVPPKNSRKLEWWMSKMREKGYSF